MLQLKARKNKERKETGLLKSKNKDKHVNV